MMLSEKPWARGHEPHKGNLWIYGDSISYYFYRSVEDKLLCKKIFRKCMVTYNWLYPKTLYELVWKLTTFEYLNHKYLHSPCIDH